MSIIQAVQQHQTSGYSSSVMVMMLWVLVPLIVQVKLVKFPGDSYQWLEYCYKALWLVGIVLTTTYKYYSSDDDFQNKVENS